jgi:heme/copper-type cytochrome/quinol oxidase subunit 1
MLFDIGFMLLVSLGDITGVLARTVVSNSGLHIALHDTLFFIALASVYPIPVTLKIHH